MTKIVETADRWTDKVNAKDVSAVLEVSDPNIELIGPQGSTSGHDTLAQWVEDSGIHLATIIRYAKGNSVVFEQQGTWENQDGQVTVYTFMEIEGSKVTRLARVDSLEEAFGMSGLNEEDKVG